MMWVTLNTFGPTIQMDGMDRTGDEDLWSRALLRERR